jgi:hypothetical protein
MFEPMFGRAGENAVVLGIDPGVSRCGYGAVEAAGSGLSAVACGVIRTPPGDPLPARLSALFAELEGLVADLRPAAPRVAPTLRRLRPALADTHVLLRRVRPLVDQLDPAVTSLRGAAHYGVPLINELLPTLSRLKSSVLPFLHSVEKETGRREYQLVGPTVAAVDSLAGLFDKQGGHVAAFEGGAGSRFFHDYQPCATYVSDPNKSEKLACESILDFTQSLFGGGPPPKTKMQQLLRLPGVRR